MSGVNLPLKVFLPIKLQPTGGTSTFARKLHDGLQSYGHSVTFSFSPSYDLLLASPRAPLKYLIHAQRHGKPVIHRLDGVYTQGTIAGWRSPAYNLPLHLIRNYFARSVIYQSRFSQAACEQHLGGPARKTTRVIYNGVDIDHFKPEGYREPLREFPKQQVFITASRFRRTDQIFPIVHAFQVYRQRYNADSKLFVLGNFSQKLSYIPLQYASKHIVFTGVVQNQILPRYLRSADAFLFTHANPPCPNNVIEALSCGLPICGVNDGSMPELVQHQLTGLLAHSNLRRKPTQLSAQLAANLALILKELPRYKHLSRQQAIVKFSLSNMIDSYLEVFLQSSQAL